uniref:DUF952 domain-containing protein n=1 Tax=Alexandrium catenella TaxID=2925 RepID=A0A7S1QD22_ALECA|mmetsp:Transcript_25411/g.69373  ORF Transcript_25411/g.69373 Transcript_25411/m.69373 type:complete len:186 (+) Transcript_25411:60-617(+)
MPVGPKAVGESFTAWLCPCPHAAAGVPPEVVGRDLPTPRDAPACTGLTDMPGRVFKLATAAEASAFKEEGKILSSLDKQDGFVHLSDRTAPPTVARLFFKDCADLRLIELDAAKLPGPVNWIVGSMGDPAPDAKELASAPTIVHFLKSDGCVHVYGKLGVPMSAVLREASVPLGEDGVHVFPEWL